MSRVHASPDEDSVANEWSVPLPEKPTRVFEDRMIARFWNPVTAAGRVALHAIVTQHTAIIAYINDCKLLMIATLVVISRLVVFQQGGRQGRRGSLRGDGIVTMGTTRLTTCGQAGAKRRNRRARMWRASAGPTADYWRHMKKSISGQAIVEGAPHARLLRPSGYQSGIGPDLSTGSQEV
jgi:hypothetical protein